MDTTDKALLKHEKSNTKSKEARVPRARFRGRLMQRKSWHELSPAQKVGNIVMAAIELTLVTFALWDLSHRPEERVNGKKRTWAMVSLIQPFGPIIYLMFGRKR